jgi:hypothetical protein
LIIATASFAQKAPSHQHWDKLLKKHVNASGMVNYKGFKQDKGELDSLFETAERQCTSKQLERRTIRKHIGSMHIMLLPLL